MLELSASKLNSTHQVVVWTKSNSPHCAAAKKLLRSSLADIDYVVRNVDDLPNQQQLERELQLLTGSVSFPYFFFNGHYFGSYQSFLRAHRDQTLRKHLQPSFHSHGKLSLREPGFGSTGNFTWSPRPPTVASASRDHLFQAFMPLKRNVLSKNWKNSLGDSVVKVPRGIRYKKPTTLSSSSSSSSSSLSSSTTVDDLRSATSY